MAKPPFEQPQKQRGAPKAHRSRPPPQRKPATRPRQPPPRHAHFGDGDEETALLYGIHAVEAALNNPDRQIHQLLLTQNAARRLDAALGQAGIMFDTVLPKDLDRRLGGDTVHQGALAICAATATATLEDLAETAAATKRPIIVLDQVTDPHNVGAVLRSGAVFGASGLVMTRRHSPPLAGTLAKSASGALELQPVALVQNLAKALADLAAAGLHIVGLDGAGDVFLEDAVTERPTVIVLGAEGKGLRQSTLAACHAVCRIATDGPITSLNVSNAGAIALYTCALRRRSPPSS